MNNLYNELCKLYNSDFYPFHMPGHKRQPLQSEPAFFTEIKKLDITEITNFDNLHDATGIIKSIEDKAARLYGADKAYLLVNGSTAGILSTLSTVMLNNKNILFARNAHKSAYNALLINDGRPDYIWLEEFTNPTICCGVDINAVYEKISNCEDDVYSAVFITSPTYEGVISDIKKIAEIAHEKNIPLIVDAAHGAHLCACEDFAEFNMINPLLCDADAVIVSLHKTLNAPTQTGLLLVNGDRIDRRCLERNLSIYQTSSPSYILMAGIENCIDQLFMGGQTADFNRYKERLLSFYKLCKNLKAITILEPEDIRKNKSNFGFDITKILITLNHKYRIEGCKSGRDLFDILRNKYHLEAEYASSDFVLVMTSVMDTDEGFDRLYHALLEIENSATLKGDGNDAITGSDNMLKYPSAESDISIYNAVRMPRKKVDVTDAAGCICADYLYAYPPGVPIIVPGEIINDNIAGLIDSMLNSGIDIKGITDGKIEVLDK